MSTKPIDYDSLQQHWGWLSPVGRTRGCSAAVGLRLSGGRLLLSPGSSALQWREILDPVLLLVLDSAVEILDPVKGGCCGPSGWRLRSHNVRTSNRQDLWRPFSIRIQTVFQDFIVAPFSSSDELMGFCEIRIDPGCSTCCER